MKMGYLLSITVGTTAAESLNAAANIFLGQTEAPLLIKPFLGIMTKYFLLINFVIILYNMKQRTIVLENMSLKIKSISTLAIFCMFFSIYMVEIATICDEDKNEQERGQELVNIFQTVIHFNVVFSI